MVVLMGFIILPLTSQVSENVLLMVNYGHFPNNVHYQGLLSGFEVGLGNPLNKYL